MNFILFDDIEYDNGNKSYITHLLSLLNEKMITMQDYQYIKEKNLTLPYLKKFKKIIKKIDKYEKKDEFISLLNYPVSSFKLKDIINDCILGCQFTKDQKKAIKKVYKFLYKEGNMFLIKGLAGTGKTFLISELVKHVNKHNLVNKIALTAPTNKAVKVLREKFDKSVGEIEFITVHKLLQYKSSYNNDGDITFVNSGKKAKLEYDIIIIDECSMLDKHIVKDIGSYCKKFIFIGDPAQLPPVNEYESSAFKQFTNKNSIMLKQVIRSNKQSIVNACNEVRKWIFYEIKHPQFSKHKDEYFTPFNI